MKGQALDKNDLNLEILDRRVDEWRINLDLLHQGNFPPPKFSISEAGVRFHDRSHILVQDYLQRDSWQLQEEYDEDSLPSIYEEALTVFAAQINHYRDRSADEFATGENFRGILMLLHQIDYIPDRSIFLTDIHRIGDEIAKDVQNLLRNTDFTDFRETLTMASRDTLGWDNTHSRGANG